MVIKSIYGREGGLGQNFSIPNSKKRITWHNIRKACNNTDELNLPFSSSFVKIIGLGDKTLFWKDRWLDNDGLCNTFRRLFQLEINKEALIMDRLKKDGNAWSPCWEWVRSPRGRTNSELDSLLGLLSRFNFDEKNFDYWKWNMLTNGTFSTNFLTKMIDEKLLVSTVPLQSETLRNHHLPQKIGIFIWRSRARRIPVRVELDKRGIDLDSVRCPVCDSDVETVDHILLHCPLRFMGSGFSLVRFE
ncbi:uncharacterized protein [Rutidosis leptorrhynchoides]|uniref:uncharacterized protein n=1 Tax=Rutidosis leptorrhynchoides TaxID=125765 RepID=UPI003A9A3769